MTQCLGTPPTEHALPQGDPHTHTLRQLTTLQAVAKMMLDLVEVESMSAGCPPFPRPRRASSSAPHPSISTKAPTCSSDKHDTAGPATTTVRQADQPGVSTHPQKSAGPRRGQQQQWCTPAAVQDHLHASLVALAALEWVLEQRSQRDLTQPAGLMSEGLLTDTLWTLLELLHDLLCPIWQICLLT